MEPIGTYRHVAQNILYGSEEPDVGGSTLPLTTRHVSFFHFTVATAPAHRPVVAVVARPSRLHTTSRRLRGCRRRTGRRSVVQAVAAQAILDRSLSSAKANSTPHIEVVEEHLHISAGAVDIADRFGGDHNPADSTGRRVDGLTGCSSKNPDVGKKMGAVEAEQQQARNEIRIGMAIRVVDLATADATKDGRRRSR